MPNPILQFFNYEHLPSDLQEISKKVHEVAMFMAENLPENPEKSAGLRKLLEAKDAFVRARRATKQPRRR